jgi:hypothetical protein
VDAAFDRAVAGETVYFPEGVYAHSGALIVPDGVNVQGAGIYKPSDGSGTWLNCGIKWGSNQTISDLKVGGQGTKFYPVSRATTNASERSKCPTTYAQGSHDVTFRRVRFRGASNLINLGAYSGDWTSRVNKTDCYHTYWYDCEFERGNDMNNVTLNSAAHAGEGNIFNIWVDCRAGGAQIYDLRWVRCHFGVKNGIGTSSGDGHGAAAQPNGYGCNRLAILMQPAPAEWAANGPRRNLTTFDWDRVTHMYPGPYLIEDCVFEWSWEITLNPCDDSRAYSISRGWGNPTGSRWVDIPERFWLQDMTITGNTFKGNVPGGQGGLSESVIVGEQMRYCTSTNNTSGQGNLGNPHDGRFGNVNRDNRGNTGQTAYTRSVYDP